MATNISVVLTIDNSQYTADLKRAELATKQFADKAQAEVQKTDNSMRRLNDNTNLLVDGFGRLTALLTGGALIGFANSALAMADAVDDLANATGIAVDRILAFQTAVQYGGGNAEAASRGITTLFTKIDEAAGGSLRLQQAFEDLNISVEDLRNLSEQGILNRTLEALAQMEPGAKKTALQGELLGKAFRNITIDPAFIENLRNGEVEAVRVAEGIRRAAEFNERFERSFNQLRLAFLEVFTPFLEKLTQFTVSADAVRTTMQILAAVVAAVFSAAVIAKVIGLATAMIQLARATSAVVAGQTALNALTGVGLARVAAAAAAGTAAYVALGRVIDEAAESASRVGSGTDPGAGTEIEVTAQREVIDALAARRAEIQRLSEAYQQSSNRTLQAIENETRLVGLSRTNADIIRAQTDAYNRAEAEINRLTEAKSRLTAEEIRGGLAGQYDEQIAQIRRIRDEEQSRLATAIEQRNQTELNNRVRLFGLQQELDVTRRVREIQNEVANMFLPELERRYRAITQAANESARAQVESLAQQQNMSVSEFTRTYPEQVASVYRAAAAGVRELSEAERARFAAQSEGRQLNFELQTRISHERDLQRILDEQARVGLSEIERRYYDIGAAARDSARERIRAEEQARFGAMAGTAPEFTLAGTDPAAVARITQEANRGTEELRQQTEALYESSRRFETGWNRAFREYADNASNAARNAETIFTRATRGMEDAFVQFARTGRFEWRNFVSSILEELLRQQVRQTIASVFGATGMGNIGNQGSNNSSGLLGSLLGFANGGIIPTNGPVLVGERGPELISGAAGRFVTPNEQLGGTSVTYNIQAVDALSFRQLVARDPGFIHAVASRGGSTIPVRR